MLNKCKIKDGTIEVLFYGTEEELNFPEYLNLETIEKDVKINKDTESLTILSARQLLDKVQGKQKRTTDIILSENRINSFKDLKAAYFLVRYHQLSASKSVRDKIVQKYTDVLEYVEDLKEEENGSRTESNA